jgi:hypothetical protein
MTKLRSFLTTSVEMPRWSLLLIVSLVLIWDIIESVEHDAVKGFLAFLASVVLYVGISLAAKWRKHATR